MALDEIRVAERTALTFAVSAVVAVSLMGVSPTPTSGGSDADTVAIVSLLLKDRLESRGEAPPGDYLVLVAETIVLCPPSAEEGEEDRFSIASMVRASELLPEVPESLRTALLCEQEAGMLPSARFKNAEFVLESQIDAIFSGDGWWEEFYRTFPESRGFVQFTAPAYSADGKHALIYVSHSCGGLCGTGWLIYLSKLDGKWGITAQRMLWIS